MTVSTPMSIKDKERRKRIALFGHFGAGNFGNEGTLQAILYHLRRVAPDAEITCICTNPETVAADYNIATVKISGIVVKPWTIRNLLVRLLRKIFIGIPSELYRWFRGYMTLRGTDVVIVPGTGLLTDAYSLVGWGPYNTFKWSVIAKVCRCKLLFVSVGAGPLYSSLGKILVRSALFLADFRSYRDQSTKRYLQGIGFRSNNDRVYPDLAFSLPEAWMPAASSRSRRRTVVGIGLMEYAGRYSVDRPSKATYIAYLDNLTVLVRWLLAHEYDIRLLIGDIQDREVTQQFISLLKERSGIYEEGRLIEDPVLSVVDLLSQIAETDMVVATRFHNVLMALLLNKPVISISFHHKCVSLMSQMGLSEYNQDINDLTAEELIAQFRKLETNAGTLREMIRQKAEGCRKVLDEQYDLVFKGMALADGKRNTMQQPTAALLPQGRLSLPPTYDSLGGASGCEVSPCTQPLGGERFTETIGRP
jgi:polysaccharide pyruvyl transferase WcaK-like protein